MSADSISRSLIYRGFRKCLRSRFGPQQADPLWQNANRHLATLQAAHPGITGDARMMILPAAALYTALREAAPQEALPMLTAYGQQTGEKLSRIIHAFTCIPGVPQLLWRNMPALMRKMSSPDVGYTRRIVSETDELVAVDILACPLHDAAIRLGLPEVACVVCAMDKAYMTGFRHIRYTRTTSVAEGTECCDYRLSYDKSKK